MTAPPLTRRYRIAVANRIAAAAGGGYAVAVLTSIACAFACPAWLAMSRAEAVMTGMWVAILAVPVTAMACVWADSGARAWIGVGLACAALAGIALALGWSP